MVVGIGLRLGSVFGSQSLCDGGGGEEAWPGEFIGVDEAAGREGEKAEGVDVAAASWPRSSLHCCHG